MKILIIGAKGMLGQELVRTFSSGHEVTAWDKEEIDITKNAECRAQILELKPDLLINAAAYNDVDRAEEEVELTNRINGEGPANLAMAANELGATFAHYSTSYVFDGTKEGGYVEEDQPRPLSAYGFSKLKGEEGAQKANKFYILRLDRLFGKTGGGKKSFVENMLKFAQTQKEIKVINNELGSPTYAPDLAERTRFILENKYEYGVYHCTNSGSCSWYEWAKEIFRIKGISVKLISKTAEEMSKDYKRKARRPKNSSLINTKLPPMRSWQEALTEFLSQT